MSIYGNTTSLTSKLPSRRLLQLSREARSSHGAESLSQASQSISSLRSPNRLLVSSTTTELGLPDSARRLTPRSLLASFNQHTPTIMPPTLLPSGARSLTSSTSTSTMSVTRMSKQPKTALLVESSTPVWKRVVPRWAKSTRRESSSNTFRVSANHRLAHHWSSHTLLD